MYSKVSRQSVKRVMVRYARTKFAIRQSILINLIKKPGTFGVVSAYTADTPKSRNQKQHGSIIGDIQRMGYRKVYTITGQWQQKKEESLLIHSMKADDVFALGKKHKQDAVIYKGKDGVIGMYYFAGYAEIATTPTAEAAFQLSQGKDLYSKDRNWSFEFGFLWGQHIPWDGRTPFTKKDVERFIANGQLVFE